MADLQIGVLGELSVTRDGSPIEVTGKGRRALLAFLATTPGRPVMLDRIVDGLWGADPPASAVKVVQTHVSQLRRILEPDRDSGWELIVTHSPGYALAVDPYRVDSSRFEAVVRDASEVPLVDAVEPLRDALALWRGPPYAGMERPFVDIEVARLQRLRQSALSRCLAGELARGRHEEIQAELRSLLAEYPLDESIAELLMLALYRSGQAAEALRTHVQMRQRLAEELGADPGPSLNRLHEQILRHEPGLDLVPERIGPDPRPATESRARGNLPVPRSSFIGRRTEVAEVAAMVRRNRLTTLVGAGGAGKTRLGLRAAEAASDAFESAWLVALGPLDAPEYLDGHCLTELGIIDQMDRTPGDTLRGWIGSRHVLIVLDNCEHLADAVAGMVDRLLATCPRLHLLATSRQPLHCPGEQQWRVPTLSLPAVADVDGVANSEAGSLFVERATEARPDFVLDDSTAAAVHQICRRLDGIPLAIELAAVRMATMSAAELASGLDARFQLLTSGNRTALPRHRTLLATTDWSYDLLDPPQQHVLCRLSTFAADFEVEAATDVCGVSPLEPREVPGLLADLVDHSLVESHTVDGTTRYRLLETVREYGRERLGDDAQELAHRYGQWVAHLVEAVGANAQLDTVRWYARLDREFNHVQAAFTSAVRRGDAETALRIAAGSGWALIIIGRFHRLREWLRQALALAAEGTVDDRVLGQGLMMAGAVAGIDHRFDGTLDLLADAEARFKAAGSTEGILWTRYWRAATLAEMGQLDAGLDQIEDVVAWAGKEGLGVVEANACAEQAELIVAGALARGHLVASDLAEAGAALTRARELIDSYGMPELSARVGLSEALIAGLRGEAAEALVLAQERLGDWRALGRGNRLILGLVATAKLALLAGRPGKARPLVAEAIRLIGEFAWSGALRGAAEVAAALSVERDPAAAAVLLGAAEAREPTHRWRMPIDLSSVTSRLRDALGREAYGTHHADGAARSLDGIVELALAALAATPAEPA